MEAKIKYVKLVSLGKNYTTQEQFEKIKEEFKEVEVGYRNYKHNHSDISNKEQLKTELYDLMQASYHMLELLDAAAADNKKHLKKIEKYIKSGRIKTGGCVMASEEFLDRVQKLIREGKTVKCIADELKISYARAVTYIRKIGARITEQEEQLFNDIFKNAGKKVKVKLKNGEDLAFLEKFEYSGKIKIMPLEEDGCYEIEKIGG